MAFRSKPAYFKVRSKSDPDQSLLLCRQNQRWLIAMTGQDSTGYRHGTLTWNAAIQEWVLKSDAREWRMGPDARTGIVDIEGYDLLAATSPTVMGDWRDTDAEVIESARQWALEEKHMDSLDLYSEDRRSDLGLA